MRQMEIDRSGRYYGLWAICTALCCVGLSFARVISDRTAAQILGMGSASIFDRLKPIFWSLIAFILISEGILRNGWIERKTGFLLVVLACACAVFALPGTDGRGAVLAISLAALALFFALCFFGCARPAVHSLFSLTFSALVLLVLTSLCIAYSLFPPENFFF